MKFLNYNIVISHVINFSGRPC